MYLYPVDGSCFTPTGGLSQYYGVTLQVVNSTSVAVTWYYDSLCQQSYYNEVYEIDACSDYYEVSIFQTMPSDQYWIDQNLTGYYGPWDTVLSVDYYNSNCQSNSWIDREVTGFSECSYGNKYYCENNQLHYDACTDATCDSGCVQVYEPLNNTCTAGANTPAYWSYYLDTGVNSYQATCGPAPAPSPSASPSAIPSASPSAVPNDDSSSSSDEPSEGVWILLLIIAFLLGIIIGLLVGFAIYSKVTLFCIFVSHCN